MTKMLRTALLSFVIAVPTVIGFAQPATGDHYLLPIFVPPIEGAQNSRWVTDLTVFNRSEDRAVHVVGLLGPCQILCPPVEEAVFTLPPRQSRANFHPTGSPGSFITISTDELPLIAAHLNVRDTGRSQLNSGTELPVVSQSEFRSRIDLVGIPFGDHVRHMLRVYGAYGERSGQVRIRIYQLGSTASPDTPLLERELELTPPSASVRNPAYLQFSDFPVVPPFPGLMLQPYRVEVESLDGTNIWAFVSVTNNETQLISTVTPQP